MSLPCFELSPRQRLLGHGGWCRVTAATSCLLDRDDTEHSSGRTSVALITCRCARSMPPLLPSEWGGIIRHYSTNYGLVEKLDGSGSGAPKEKQHEVKKIGGLLWWCLKIIIGIETNSREKTIQPSPDCLHNAAQLPFNVKHSLVFPEGGEILAMSVPWTRDSSLGHQEPSGNSRAVSACLLQFSILLPRQPGCSITYFAAGSPASRQTVKISDPFSISCSLQRWCYL